MTPGKEKEKWILCMNTCMLFYGTLMPCEYANNLVLTFFIYFFENYVCCYAVHALKLAMNNIEINTMFQMTMTTLV